MSEPLIRYEALDRPVYDNVKGIAAIRLAEADCRNHSLTEAGRDFQVILVSHEIPMEPSPEGESIPPPKPAYALLAPPGSLDTVDFFRSTWEAHVVGKIPKEALFGWDWGHYRRADNGRFFNRSYFCVMPHAMVFTREPINEEEIAETELLLPLSELGLPLTLRDPRVAHDIAEAAEWLFS